MTGSIEDALIFGYQPPGPVAADFINDTRHQLVGIMGPFGSGKTSACPIKGQLISRLQPPSKSDGWIRSQGYVIRSTYRQLWDKTIPSWQDVFPVTDDWQFSGPKNGPAKHVIRWRDKRPDGRMQTFEMIVNFVALADQSIDEFTRGLLATWIWLNEADTLPGDAVGSLIGRLGRYPPPHLLPDKVEPGFGCVMCDFNAPNTSNWTYEKFFRNPSDGTQIYVQPSGLSPQAENPVLRKLKPDYYSQLAADMEDWQVKRFIENKVGFSRNGQPVYTEFARDRHVSEAGLVPWKGVPILLGVDQGLTAAVVFGQKGWDGRTQDLQSLVTPDGHVTDAVTLGEQVREICAGEYSSHACVGMIDPAGWNRSDLRPDDPSWAELFIEASGVPCIPAPTNAIAKRHRGVRRELDKSVGGGPAHQIDPQRNETLIEGFTAGYRVRKLSKGEDQRYADQPEKNHFSHVHDARQYLALLRGGSAEVVDQMIELQADRLRSSRGDGAVGAVLNDF